MKSLYTLVAAALLCAVRAPALAQTSSTSGASGSAKIAADSAKAQPAQSAASAAPSAMPQTKILASGNGSYDPSGDPLLNPPPLPRAKVTLIGGAVRKLDPIRERLTVEPFGTGTRFTVAFDERTHVYRDGRQTTYAQIHKGDRVYVDTMSLGPSVFAKNIRVVTQLNAADASGQVLAYNPRTGTMKLQDQLSGAPVSFTVGPQTVIKLRNGTIGSAAQLNRESLVAVQFFPGRGRNGVAKQVDVIALPGETFNFAGTITHVDIRSHSFAVENQTDGKIYDLIFDPMSGNPGDLHVGKNVEVVAIFTGTGYRTQSVKPQ